MQDGAEDEPTAMANILHRNSLSAIQLDSSSACHVP